MSTTYLRLLNTLAATALLMLSITTVASADCCDHVTFNNMANCSFNVRMTIDGNVTTWTINPGMNVFPFTMCFSVTAEIIDMCGDVRPLPHLDGLCFQITPWHLCCVKVCRVRACEWDIVPANCVYC